MQFVTGVTLPNPYAWRNSHPQEAAMLLTLNNRIDGKADISPVGYAVLLVALLSIAWLIGG